MGGGFSPSEEGDRVASTGTHWACISKLTVRDWPRGLWLEYISDVCKADYSIMGFFSFSFFFCGVISDFV